MQNSTGFVNGIIPPYAQWENRGNQFFHPDTGSSLSYPISYCKDIRGCGNKSYRNFSVVVTLNYLDGCVPRLNGVMSISGLVLRNATPSQLDHLYEFAMGGHSELPTGTADIETYTVAEIVCA